MRKRYQVRSGNVVFLSTDDRREAEKLCSETPYSHVWSYDGSHIIMRHGDKPRLQPIGRQRPRML